MTTLESVTEELESVELHDKAGDHQEKGDLAKLKAQFSQQMEASKSS